MGPSSQKRPLQIALSQSCHSGHSHGCNSKAGTTMASASPTQRPNPNHPIVSTEGRRAYLGRQAEAKADRRELPADPKLLERSTLGDVLVRYRDTVVTAKGSREIETIILNAILRTDLAKLQLADLSPAPFAQYRDRRLAYVKPVTVNRELQLIQHALELARCEWGVPLPENTLHRVRRPQTGPSRDRRLRHGEMERLLTAAQRSRNKYIMPLITLAVETAMRQGELLRIGWQDVSLTSRTLRIPVAKNGYARTIPLSSSALQCLHQLQIQTTTGEARVFPVSSRAVKLAWKRLTKRASIEDLHFHDLRHEAVSRLFEMGLSLPEVSLISGHRGPRMLFRYTHPRADEIAKKLS